MKVEKISTASSYHLALQTIKLVILLGTMTMLVRRKINQIFVLFQSNRQRVKIIMKKIVVDAIMFMLIITCKRMHGFKERIHFFFFVMIRLLFVCFSSSRFYITCVIFKCHNYVYDYEILNLTYLCLIYATHLYNAFHLVLVNIRGCNAHQVTPNKIHHNLWCDFVKYC